VINGLLYNCAAVIQSGALLGIVPKTYLPNYGEFYEKRWFASAQDLNPTDIYFAGGPVKVSAEPLLFQTYNGVKLTTCRTAVCVPSVSSCRTSSLLVWPV
ncbi:MAG: hypothetical protein IIU00_09155, partial [Clostridia bacterium]|nr:hypothetical protein [Clostridia bacterium]